MLHFNVDCHQNIEQIVLIDLQTQQSLMFADEAELLIYLEQLTQQIELSKTFADCL